MQSLLAAQSGMVSFPETQFFLLVPSAPEQQSVAESVLDQLLVGLSKHIQISAFAASRLRELCRNGELSAKGLFEQIVCDQIVQRLGGDGLRRRWVEKSPWHGFHMDRIVAYYPQAKFIFIYAIHYIVLLRAEASTVATPRVGGKAGARWNPMPRSGWR